MSTSRFTAASRPLSPNIFHLPFSRVCGRIAVYFCSSLQRKGLTSVSLLELSAQALNTQAGCRHPSLRGSSGQRSFQRVPRQRPWYPAERIQQSPEETAALGSGSGVIRAVAFVVYTKPKEPHKDAAETGAWQGLMGAVMNGNVWDPITAWQGPTS